ncbi:hemin uptake protein HemP [Ramlibacter humi]|uniref:Hemin uptake protein HemP n=1 Tax=Ramlibacter humi TaxID=2530451 RepID=A0A4Z0CAE4_9BURK|nr:hemin uptake protein HemP [Ramlibacter humi]TFZ08637.1 hemin uptake protein HemP [Ramlibacter humi]
MTAPTGILARPLEHAGQPAHGTLASNVHRQQLDSTELLRGGRCVEIRHNGEVYRLQATRLGKLILTK